MFRSPKHSKKKRKHKTNKQKHILSPLSFILSSSSYCPNPWIKFCSRVIKTHDCRHECWNKLTPIANVLYPLLFSYNVNWTVPASINNRLPLYWEGADEPEPFQGTTSRSFPSSSSDNWNWHKSISCYEIIKNSPCENIPHALYINTEMGTYPSVCIPYLTYWAQNLIKSSFMKTMFVYFFFFSISIFYVRWYMLISIWLCMFLSFGKIMLSSVKHEMFANLFSVISKGHNWVHFAHRL